MTSYYIDPERCFEVPFRIPLPDKEKMATRLANIRLITKNARERQSLSNAEHRRKLSTRLGPAKYRDKAKAVMECGRLEQFVGNLTERYLDYLDFHQESLNDSELSPLIILVPQLCSPLSAPSPCLFDPPRQGDYNEVIRSNLSWSQFAAPVPAGWRERFLYDRRWERYIERRALDEYSDKERVAEHTAIEFQRRQLGILLQTTSNTSPPPPGPPPPSPPPPPPLRRNRFIPLPPTTPSSLLPDVLPCEDSMPLKCDSWATCNLSSKNGGDMIFPPSRIPLQIEAESVTTSSVRQQPPSEHSTQNPSHSCQLSRQRPSLYVTIPDTERSRPWLDRGLCDSPLSGIDVEIPRPSVLLNADAVRAYLDNVHGPHSVLPQPEPLQQAYPQSPKSPPQRLSPSKRVIALSTERMSAGAMRPYDIRESSLTVVPDVQSSVPNMAPPGSSTPKQHISQLRSLYALKRRACHSSITASNNPLKKRRLVTLIPTNEPLMIFSS